jgi:TP901 family phage tail tape measure protein
MKQEYTLRAKYEGQGELGKFRGDLQALGKIETIKALGKDVRELTVRFNEAKAKLEEQAKALKSGGQVTKEMTRAYADSQREVSRLAAAIEKKSQAFRSSTAAAREAGVNTKALTAEEKRLQASAEATGKVWAARQALGVRSHSDIRSEVARLARAYQDLKNSGVASAAELHQAQHRLKLKTAELIAETNGWGASYERARNGAVAMAGIGYALLQSFKSFAEFETGMAEVYTLVDVSADKFAEFKKETKDIAGDLPQESNNLTKALYDIVSAGVALEDANAVLKQSGKAATAGVTDTTTAVNIGMGVLNAYGKRVDELGNVYDVLFQTVNKGVTTFPELSQSIGNVLPTARAAGVDLENVGAAIATLTKAGIKTPQAVTALNGAILSMSAATPEAKKKFEELGITWEGFLPTLEAIAEQGLSLDEMRMLIPDAEAAKGVLALTQNIDVLKEVLVDIEHAGGATESAYKKMANTPAQKIKMMEKSLHDLSVGVGQFASMVIVPTAEALGWLITKLNDSPAAVKVLTHFIGAAVTAGVAWKLGLKDVATGLVGTGVRIYELAGKTEIFVGAVGRARAGMIALRTAAMAHPVFAAFAAVALVAGAAWLVFGKNSLEASKSHGEAAKAIGEGRKEIDGEVVALEKLQQALKNSAPGSEAHLKAERELAKLLPDANLSLDKQGNLIADVGDAADENAKKLQNYIDKLKEQSKTELALQLERQAKAVAEAQKATDEQSARLAALYGINEEVSLRQRINKAIEESVGWYDKEINKWEESKSNLAAQKAEWNSLMQAMSQAGMSADDVAIALDKAHVSAELKQSIIADYEKLGSAIAETGTDAEQAAEKQEKAFADAAESIKQEYLDLAAKIKSTYDEISSRNQSFQSEIREMAREGMSDVDAWDDLKKEADEYATAARNAISAGNYDEAVRLADEAKQKYKELNTEVKDGEKVVISEQEAREESIKLMQKANEIAIEALNKRAEADKEAAADLEKQIGLFKDGWHSAFEAFLKDGQAAIKDLEKQLDAITKERTIPVTIKTSEAKQSGGIIGLRMAAGGAVAFRNMLAGGHFPGFGGGDRRHVIAEDGEYMFDKYRVRDARLDVVRAFHRGDYAYVIQELTKRVRSGIRMNIGGLVENVQRITQPLLMANGGTVSGGGVVLRHEHVIRIGSSAPATVYSDDLNAERLFTIFRRAQDLSS